MPVKILVVDVCPTTRLGVEALLGVEGDLDVVGEAGEAEAALLMAAELVPGLVIQDLELEVADGARLCRELKGMPQAPQVLFHTARNSHQDVYSCYLAGADGFVHKSEEPERLVDAARQVLSGKRVWLLGREPEEDGSLAHPEVDGSHLTAKEQEILVLILEGLTNRRMAETLCVSLDTVKTHTRGVYRKLGVSGRSELFAARRVDGLQ